MSYNPSAPPMPPSSSSSNTNSYNHYNHNQTNYTCPPSSQSYHVSHQSYSSNYGHSYNPFPPGTDPEIIRSFQMVDRDNSGFIDDCPGEFAALWSCLGQWRAIFERFDRDRSGKIEVDELRDALYSLGYAVPPSVLQLLISRYDNTIGRKAQLNFDNFVECGMVVKGLTEKFKEKDSRYSGSATITYEDFMSMVLPYLVTYN
ncbi:calcium-binding protein CBP isoform X2 [Amaranthus tricolor]|uniref:calcium-binding protein CBP isoform X2 n=1 Tax=Amaranthus tricolor TaxID=29722 RepID=UPI00258E312B|nr:calcium-binding protein CBP isoform X2 [Amaranthus tricolor]